MRDEELGIGIQGERFANSGFKFDADSRRAIVEIDRIAQKSRGVTLVVRSMSQAKKHVVVIGRKRMKIFPSVIDVFTGQPQITIRTGNLRESEFCASYQSTECVP